MFASVAGELLGRSKKIRSLVSSCYPIIIVDEYQDTNTEEWTVISTLGRASTIIALADPNQRIYDFRGSDPLRLDEFREAFAPSEFHFERQNFRSGETDIARFGDGVLAGSVNHYEYEDVEIVYYKNRRPLFSELKYKIIKSIQRLNKAESPDWSIAVLVPTRYMMLKMSKVLSTPMGNVPTISHEVLVDPMGPALSANIIAMLMNSGDNASCSLNKLIDSLVAYLRGCKGSKPTKENMRLAEAFTLYLSAGKKIRGKNRLSTLNSGKVIIERCREINLSGDPKKDWLSIREILGQSGDDTWLKVYNDAKYISLLKKGKRLAHDLSVTWRENGCYKDASLLVQTALEQEYFEAPRRKWKGVFVMTMHKSKGKEFDEVFLVEDVYSSRFFREPGNVVQSKSDAYVLRVGITRAKKKVTILTPRHAYCRFFGPQK